jgi:hypothetical protein
VNTAFRKSFEADLSTIMEVALLRGIQKVIKFRQRGQAAAGI